MALKIKNQNLKTTKTNYTSFHFPNFDNIWAANVSDHPNIKLNAAN